MSGWSETFLMSEYITHIYDSIIYICSSYSFPVAQMVEHGAGNAKIMGSIPRESKR